jgi:hypothetical protein
MGRFGEAVARMYCGRGLCSCLAGSGEFRMDIGCSITGIICLGLICTALEMMMGAATGSKVSDEYRAVK